MKKRNKYKSLGENAASMDETEWSLPMAWRNGELTPDNVSVCHERLLPDVQELENDLASIEKSVRDYLDAVNYHCRAGSALSTTFAKVLRDTTLSKISQQYQHISEQLEHSAHESSVDITNCVMATLCDFTSTMPGIKREIETYKRCKDHYEKCRVALESFAQKDASASEGKRFQLARERFHMADKQCTRQQEQLSQCLSALEGNRIKMLGASLLSLLHTISQFNGTSSLMLAPLGEFQSVGGYLRDRDIAAQLKQATAAWCSIAQDHQCVRDTDYLSSEEIYNVLELNKGELIDPLTKDDLRKHLKILLENYQKEVEEINSGSVVVPGGFNKNPAGIALALKGCCSQLESLASSGTREPSTNEEMITMLRSEIPKVELAVGSVGKPWCKVSNLRDSDEFLSRQHCVQDLVEPLAKQFDIPFTKESLNSFTLTVLNEACSRKTILASKVAVQLMYGKADLVVVKLSPESLRLRQVRVYCKETSVNIEVQLTWWIMPDGTLYSGILDEGDNEPLFHAGTTYCTTIDYMDYLEEKETTLPSISVDLRAVNYLEANEEKHERVPQTQTACDDSCPVPLPRTKHYARKIAERRQKIEANSNFNPSVASTDDKKSKEKVWSNLSAKFPSMERAFTSAASHLSLASESELSEVINFLSGFRGVPDANDGDTESGYSIKAMSDSGIDSVMNAKLDGKALLGEGQGKGKKGKKKEKKAAAKGENGAKKKKKKRGDKGKKDKKKSDQKEGNQEGEGINQDNGKDEVSTSTQSTVTAGTMVDQTSNEQNSDDQKTIKISENLRSVWEPIEKDPALLGNLSKQSGISASQDSIYHSCWSLPGLGNDAMDDTKSVNISEPDLNRGWSKGYENENKATKSIWSHQPSNYDKHPRRDLWPPSLTRQDGIDYDEAEQIPAVAGESVFQLGLGITGLELFAAAKQAGLPGNSKVNEDRSRMRSPLVDNRIATSQYPVWPREKLAAGQFTEKSSSCGDALHRTRNVLQDHTRLQTHHSDPFLTKGVPWNPSVPPMYMKLRYNPNIVAPFPVEDVPSALYAPSLHTRTYVRHMHPNHPPNQPLPPPDQRRNFYGPQ